MEEKTTQQKKQREQRSDKERKKTRTKTTNKADLQVPYTTVMCAAGNGNQIVLGTHHLIRPGVTEGLFSPFPTSVPLPRYRYRYPVTGSALSSLVDSRRIAHVLLYYWRK